MTTESVKAELEKAAADACEVSADSLMTTTTAASADSGDSGEQAVPEDSRGGARAAPPGGSGASHCPICCSCPALILELLVHLVPMVMGVFMSFKELTQFYIRDWGTAPWSGFDNYKVSVDSGAPHGAALLHSYLVTVGFTLLSVGLCWLIGTAAAIYMQDTFRGRGLLGALPRPVRAAVYAAVITWVFMFQHDNGLVNHVLHDQLHLTDKPSFWLIGDNSFYALLTVSVWKGWPFAFLIVMAGLQNIPGSCTRPPRPTAPVCGGGCAHRPAVPAPGQPGAGTGPVPVDVQRLQHAVRPVRQDRSGGRGPHLGAGVPRRRSSPGTSAPDPPCRSCCCSSCSS